MRQDAAKSVVVAAIKLVIYSARLQILNLRRFSRGYSNSNLWAFPTIPLGVVGIFILSIYLEFIVRFQIEKETGLKWIVSNNYT